MERGDYRAAIAEFQESISLHPHFKTLELLGECLLETADPIAAVVPLAAAASLGSNAFRASYLLARALAEVQDFEPALSHVERAIQMRPDFKKAIALKEQIGRENRALRAERQGPGGQ
jgi:tetratricopeptide (TPR) repeat protein